MEYMENCKVVAIEQNTPEWMAWRNNGIGASEIAAVMGVSKWETPISVWAKKVGFDKAEPEENENMEWGHRLENAITDKWLDEFTSYQLEIRGPVFERTDMPWMRASLDNIVRAPDGKFESLECKTSGRKDDWFDTDGNEIVPEYYLWQAIWQMAVTGIRVVHFSVLILGRSREWLNRTVEWDEKNIFLAISRGKEFWEMVESGTMPALDVANPELDGNALKNIFPEVNDSTLETGDKGETELNILIALEAQKSNIEKAIESTRNFFKAQMGEAKTCTANGRKVCSASSSERVTIDSKKLKEEKPEIYGQYGKKSIVKTYRFAV